MPNKPDWTGAGNINLFSRPFSKNPDGTTSSLYSTSFSEGGPEILIPGVDAHGKGIISNKAAINQYHNTGKYLGKFLSVPEADQYGEQLHNDAAAGYYKPPMASSRQDADPELLGKVLRFLLTRQK